MCGVNDGDATCSSAPRKSARIDIFRSPKTAAKENASSNPSSLPSGGSTNSPPPAPSTNSCAPRLGSPRRVKDLIEEELFARRRNLFSALDLVFFDTTSLFFTGNGGDTLGQYGKSKDHRSDCKQMVLGMVIDGDGIAVCSEMWPGNTTDVTTLDQVAERLQSRFGVRRVCLVANAGMISKKMIAAVEARGWFYILGARLRRTKEVRDVVLSDTELTAIEIALRYKQLWMVEQLFRTAKSLLDTRPIFHKTDATICGHVFCSFLALVLRDELFRRMDNAGVSAEWDDILRDLNALTETAITYNGKTFVVRSNTVGVAGKIAQYVGVRLPNTVRQIDDEKESADQSL